MAKSEVVDTLEALREGATMLELESALREVIASVKACGKPGKITLTLTARPMKGAEPNMIFLADDLKVSLPKLDRTATFFFATENNGLSRRDPRQPELGFTTGKLMAMPAGDRE
jgi:hypothetical protein